MENKLNKCVDEWVKEYGVYNIIKLKESLRKVIEDDYEYCKETERDNLNKLPDEVAIKLQSGWLQGYADALVKFKLRLLGNEGVKG